MTDSTFEPTAGGHDGRCQKTTGSYFYLSDTQISIGNSSAIAFHVFVRFPNVNIPANSEIVSAKLRFISDASDSSTTCNVNLHFEDADNPSAPSSGADIVGRTLTSAVAWSGIGSWSTGNQYDSPELKTILQAVIDRGGWASGQAVIANIVDNSSNSNARRRFCAYENGNGWANPVQLIVSYTTPIVGDVEDSFSMSDVIDAEYGHGSTEDSFTISDEIDALATTSPIEDSLTLSDAVEAEKELHGDLSDSLTLSDEIDSFKETLSDFSDSFQISDDFEAFHYTSWLRQNLDRAKQRFFFTLTGDADGTTDAEIKMSSFYARKKSGEPTFLQVVIPSFNYAERISDRVNGDMIVEMGYEVDGEVELREQILIADLEEVRPDEGAKNRSITLTGHRTVSYANQIVTLLKNQASYRSVQGNNLAYRFHHVDPYLNPGDTCRVGSDEFTVNNVVYIVGALRSTMEVREGI